MGSNFVLILGFLHFDWRFSPRHLQVFHSNFTRLLFGNSRSAEREMVDIDLFTIKVTGVKWLLPWTIYPRRKGTVYFDLFSGSRGSTLDLLLRSVHFVRQFSPRHLQVFYSNFTWLLLNGDHPECGNRNGWHWPICKVTGVKYWRNFRVFHVKYIAWIPFKIYRSVALNHIH